MLAAYLKTHLSLAGHTPTQQMIDEGDVHLRVRYDALIAACFQQLKRRVPLSRHNKQSAVMGVRNRIRRDLIELHSIKQSASRCYFPSLQASVKQRIVCASVWLERQLIKFSPRSKCSVKITQICARFNDDVDRWQRNGVTIGLARLEQVVSLVYCGSLCIHHTRKIRTDK